MKKITLISENIAGILKVVDNIQTKKPIEIPLTATHEFIHNAAQNAANDIGKPVFVVTGYFPDK